MTDENDIIKKLSSFDAKTRILNKYHSVYKTVMSNYTYCERNKLKVEMIISSGDLTDKEKNIISTYFENKKKFLKLC